MSTTFSDHFSGHAQIYQQYRPGYPGALFDYLSEIAPERELAWDCATGSGQAASELASRFARVLGTDASRQQLIGAEQHDELNYAVALAEACPAASRSVDLVTVAQALHWFRFEAFYAEVQRVLKPGGIVAVWCYELCRITPEIDQVVDRFYTEVVGPYWPPERAHIEAGYTTVPFPFRRLEPPVFEMSASWSFEHYFGYLGTWSAVQRYRKARGVDPLADLREPLLEQWGGRPEHSRTVTWPLPMLVGVAD